MVRQEVDSDRLRTLRAELEQKTALLPAVLQTSNCIALVDHLTSVFKDADWSSAARCSDLVHDAPADSSGWNQFQDLLREDPDSAQGQAEIQAMDIALTEMHANIKGIQASTSFPSQHIQPPEGMQLQQAGDQDRRHEAIDGKDADMARSQGGKRSRLVWTYQEHMSRSNPEADAVHDPSLPPRFPLVATRPRTRRARSPSVAAQPQILSKDGTSSGPTASPGQQPTWNPQRVSSSFQGVPNPHAGLGNSNQASKPKHALGKFANLPAAHSLHPSDHAASDSSQQQQRAHSRSQKPGSRPAAWPSVNGHASMHANDDAAPLKVAGPGSWRMPESKRQVSVNALARTPFGS
ncbi:hypothetical protein WJX79_010686 [Trebouxia sp. C0005]